MISFVVDANFVELHSVPFTFCRFFSRAAGRTNSCCSSFISMEFFLLILPAYLLLVTCRLVLYNDKLTLCLPELQYILFYTAHFYFTPAAAI